MVDSTKTSITLGWEKPVYDGGSEITHYTLDQMNSEEREWVTINPQVKTCEYVVSHLKPGTYYFFRVSAVNCKGKGEDIKMYQPVQAKDILGSCSTHLNLLKDSFQRAILVDGFRFQIIALKFLHFHLKSDDNLMMQLLIPIACTTPQQRRQIWTWMFL